MQDFHQKIDTLHKNLNNFKELRDFQQKSALYTEKM